MLFVLATFSTLTIWSTDPFVDRAYEWSVFLLAAWVCLTGSRFRWRFVAPIAVLALWGFCQWGLGATVDREATLNASLRFAAYAATSLVACVMLRTSRARAGFLVAFVWLGLAVGMLGVLAYYTSRGKILWLIDAPYPDVWGPFLSRNNFAQFLELTLPVALWRAFSTQQWIYAAAAAGILAAGLASASRAGAILLITETCLAFVIVKQQDWKKGLGFAALTALLAGVLGAATLVGRFAQTSPFAGRAQIYRATVALIETRPWQGYGLGTYASVYPEFAEIDLGYKIDHAHNDALEFLAEGGVGFLIAGACWVFPIARKSLFLPWAWGIPVVLAHSLVDYPLARFGIAAWVFILLGAVEATDVRASHFLRRST
ncbi:MAG: O-antigen ligase family protein [Acidobacteriota bacterium]